MKYSEHFQFLNNELSEFYANLSPSTHITIKLI